MKKEVIRLAEEEIREIYGDQATCTNALEYAFESYLIDGKSARDYQIRIEFKKARQEQPKRTRNKIIQDLEVRFEVSSWTIFRAVEHVK